jgi:hypothetical protein
MRTFSTLLAAAFALLAAAPRVSAQCNDLGGACLRATAECFGSLRICCTAGFGASNLDPQAAATFFLIGDRLRQPILFPSSCAPNSFCTLHVDPRAYFLLPAAVDPAGVAVITATIPCEPALVGAGFTYQVAQVIGSPARSCVGLTNGVQVVFQARGLCR